MVETRGFIGSVEAADAMVKAANVALIGTEISVRGMSPCWYAGMSARSRPRPMPEPRRRVASAN